MDTFLELVDIGVSVVSTYIIGGDINATIAEKNKEIGKKRMKKIFEEQSKKVIEEQFK